MAVTRLARWGLALWCGVSLLLAACGGAASPAPATPGGDGTVIDTVAGTAPTPTAGPSVPDTVPILENAEDLSVTADASYIAYTAAGTFEDTVAYYQTELEGHGWERINQNDASFGSSTTLLRSRPEANISVTIQSVAGDDNSVRVLISWTKK
jgi:hypothetical protein